MKTVKYQQKKVNKFFVLPKRPIAVKKYKKSDWVRRRPKQKQL